MYLALLYIALYPLWHICIPPQSFSINKHDTKFCHSEYAMQIPMPQPLVAILISMPLRVLHTMTNEVAGRGPHSLQDRLCNHLIVTFCFAVQLNEFLEAFLMVTCSLFLIQLYNIKGAISLCFSVECIVCEMNVN